MKKVIEILGALTVSILFAMVIIQTASLLSCKTAKQKTEDRLTCEMLKNYFFYNQNSSCEDEWRTEDERFL